MIQMVQIRIKWWHKDRKHDHMWDERGQQMLNTSTVFSHMDNENIEIDDVRNNHHMI